jgi:nicotinate phosphoribosyltransferase
MLQFIWKHFPKADSVFSLVNRSSAVRLAEIVGVEELVRQLEHVRSLCFLRSELIWLAGNTFYGFRGIFEPVFLE